MDSTAGPSGQHAVSATVSAPEAQWRSATEHDVYADNRDEDIFGWVQPDEWDTIAGPNKTNFMRGECVECATDQDRSAAVPSTLQRCGGPSCGYGAQCCEYSRRATHTAGPSQRTPAFLLQQRTAKTGSSSSKIADLAKVEQKTSLGVSLVDIIHGRSCRPISLLDLRTFLHFQRQPHKRLPSYYPASDMQSSALNGFDLNLDAHASSSSPSSPSSPHLIKEKSIARGLHYDEVDALDFLVAYERYLTRFRDQARSDRLKSPDPATCKAAVRAYVRRAYRPRASSDLTALDVLRQGATNHDDISDIPEDSLREVLARLKPTDLGLEPERQPLRVEFDRLVHRYLCSRRVCILPSSRKARKKRDSNSSSDTATNLQQLMQSGSPDNNKMPRLRWMVDVGLISEGDLQLSLAECDYSTHPDVLAPIAAAVYAYMSQHVVPFFFISVARNLRPNTKRGRLLVGVLCTTIALVFSILLIVTPSPLAPHAGNGTGKILRWWRLLTAPIWCAGLGYILAYFTGLCVWLTLRGNREPDEEEEREREEIRSRISGEDVVGFDLAALQAAADERDLDAERDTNRWMAPEIADILTGITGQKKDKHKRQRSHTDASDKPDPRELEEGRQRSKSEVTDAGVSGKASLETSFADTSNAIGMQTYFEKDSALTMPAAVILHTPRKSSVVPGAAESAGRPSTTLSVVDLNTPHSVRPSMDRAPSSFSDFRQADANIAHGGDHGQPAPAAMRQKRVPLLNFSIGIVTKTGNELAEDAADAPVLTRDALLFDPELAARVASPDTTLGRAAGDSSPHSSPPAIARRRSLAHALLPLKSSGRLQARLHDTAMRSPTRLRADQGDMEKEAMPSIPEPAAKALASFEPRGSAPWSAASAVSSDAVSPTRPLLFAVPSNRKSRLSATTSITAVGSSPTAPTAPMRAYDTSPARSLKERIWTTFQRSTGFAVGTERVLDARVRRAQQMKAMRIMVINTLATVVAVVIVVAIP